MFSNLQFWGKIGVVLVIFQSLFLLWGFWAGSDFLVYQLFLVNLIAGPVCLIAYLIEVSKGVFREEE